MPSYTLALQYLSANGQALRPSAERLCVADPSDSGHRAKHFGEEKFLVGFRKMPRKSACLSLPKQRYIVVSRPLKLLLAIASRFYQRKLRTRKKA